MHRMRGQGTAQGGRPLETAGQRWPRWHLEQESRMKKLVLSRIRKESPTVQVWAEPKGPRTKKEASTTGSARSTRGRPFLFCVLFSLDQTGRHIQEPLGSHIPRWQCNMQTPFVDPTAAETWSRVSLPATSHFETFGELGVWYTLLDVVSHSYRGKKMPCNSWGHIS